jgi:hypothetical protein
MKKWLSVLWKKLSEENRKNGGSGEEHIAMVSKVAWIGLIERAYLSFFYNLSYIFYNLSYT